VHREGGEMTYNWMFDPLGGFVHRCIYSESGVCSAPQCEKGVKCELRPKRDDAPRAAAKGGR